MPCISDNNEFMKGLEVRPETYRTILKKEFNPYSSTDYRVTRRRISSLFGANLIYKYPLEGTKNVLVFFSPKKNYNLIIRKTRDLRFRPVMTGDRCDYLTNYAYYYCTGLEETKEGLLLKGAFLLDCFDWNFQGDVMVLYSEIIRAF